MYIERRWECRIVLLHSNKDGVSGIRVLLVDIITSRSIITEKLKKMRNIYNIKKNYFTQTLLSLSVNFM